MTNGLRGVIAAETELSDVDGEHGRLTLRGRSVVELSLCSQPEVALHFFRGLVPAAASACELQEELGRARERAFRLVLERRGELAAAPANAALRLCVAAFGASGVEPRPSELVGAFPVFVASLARLERKASLVAPEPDRSPAADLLRMLHDRVPGDAAVRALDAYWATIADHGMNASTFTARVIASTGAELTPAVLGALAALEGPLHGGAPGPVLDMLDAIGAPENAEAWLGRELADGRRLMGFGHGVYRVRDPRADVLRGVAASLASPYQALAEAVERTGLAVLRERKPERRLETNVEFYTALVLDALGIPRSLFTAAFAAGRVIGWIAHACEQRRSGRLIRPASKYVGPRAS